jgi:hypothetical protein
MHRLMRLTEKPRERERANAKPRAQPQAREPVLAEGNRGHPDLPYGFTPEGPTGPAPTLLRACAPHRPKSTRARTHAQTLAFRRSLRVVTGSLTNTTCSADAKLCVCTRRRTATCTSSSLLPMPESIAPFLRTLLSTAHPTCSILFSSPSSAKGRPS